LNAANRLGARTVRRNEKQPSTGALETHRFETTNRIIPETEAPFGLFDEASDTVGNTLAVPGVRPAYSEPEVPGQHEMHGRVAAWTRKSRRSGCCDGS